MIYLSATYFAKFHADWDAIADYAHALAPTLPNKAYVSVHGEQISIRWTTPDTDPADQYTLLGGAIDNAGQTLAACPPDMVSAMIRAGDRSYTTYYTWNSEIQTTMEAAADSLRAELVAA